MRCLLLAALWSCIFVASAVTSGPEWVLSTSLRGCTQLALLPEPSSSSFDLNGPVSTIPTGVDCPSYNYSLAASSTSTGLSPVLSAVDAASSTLFLVESETDGSMSVTSSPLGNRAASTRRNLASVKVIALALATQTATSLLLMLTSRPALSLVSYSPSTGASTPLLDIKAALNMTHAISGVLVLNAAMQEVYWVGLSANTPPLASGAPDTSALRLYAFSLRTGVADIALLSCADVVSMHFAADLGALVFVTTKEVRAAKLPPSGLTSAVVATLQTNPVSIAGSAVPNFSFATQVPNFVAVGVSTRWLPLVNRLLIGVQQSSGKYAVVTIAISSPSAGLFQADRLAVTAVTQLPLILQGGIASLTLLATSPPSVPRQTALMLNVSGIGFTQALVREGFVCSLHGVSADGTSIGAAVDVIGTLDRAGGPNSTEQINCPVPDTAIGATAAYLRVAVLAMQDRVLGDVTLTVDVNECLGALGAAACPGGKFCSNRDGGFDCIQNADCAPGMTQSGYDCVPCAVDTFKSTTGSSACVACPSGSGTSGVTGATSSPACTASDPCGTVGGGDNMPVKVRISVGISRSEFGGPNSPAGLKLRIDIATALKVPLMRIGPVEQVAADPAFPKTNVLVTFSILPASTADAEACRGGSIDPAGQSPGTIGGDLDGQLKDPNSPLHNLPGGDKIVGGVEFVVEEVSLTNSRSFLECARDSSLPLYILGGMLIILTSIYIFCPCRFPRSQQPAPPAARNFELFPAVLPIIALIFDVYFLLVLPTLELSSEWIYAGLTAILIVSGVAHNAFTMLVYGHAQLNKVGVAAAAAAVPLGKNLVGFIKPDMPPAAPVVATDSPLNIWRKDHSFGNKLFVLLGALNLSALAMLTAQFTSATTFWDLQWDAHRVGSKPYHAMLWAGGLRSLITRQLPMLALHVVVLMQLDCRLLVAAPIVAGVVALVAMIARLIHTRGLAEPGVTAARQYEPSVSHLGTSRSSSSMSARSEHGHGAKIMAGAITATMVTRIVDDSEDDEPEDANLHSIQSLPGAPMLSESAAPSAPPMSLADDPFAASKAKPHEWFVVHGQGVGSPTPFGGRGRAARRALPTKLPSEVAAAVELQSRVSVAHEAQRKIESSNSWQLLEDIGEPALELGDVLLKVEQLDEAGAPFNPAQFKQYFKRAGDVAIDARVDKAKEAQRTLASSQSWALFEALEDGATDSVMIELGDLVLKVEQLDVAGVPFNPAQIKQYIKRAKDVEIEAAAAAAEQAAAQAKIDADLAANRFVSEVATLPSINSSPLQRASSTNSAPSTSSSQRTSISHLHDGVDILVIRGADTESDESPISSHRESGQQSLPSQSPASQHNREPTSPAGDVSDEDESSTTLVMVNQCQQEAKAALTHAVSVSRLSGDSDRARRVGRGETEEARIIGDLIFTPTGSPSLTRLQSSPLVSPIVSPQPRRTVLRAVLPQKSQQAAMDVPPMVDLDLNRPRAVAAWGGVIESSADASRTPSHSRTFSSGGGEADLMSAGVTVARHRRRVSAAASPSATAAYSSPSARSRAPPMALDSPAMSPTSASSLSFGGLATIALVVPIGSRRRFPVASPVGVARRTYSISSSASVSPPLSPTSSACDEHRTQHSQRTPTRRIAKVMGFGSGSAREKLTADELRAQRQAALIERKRAAEMGAAM